MEINKIYQENCLDTLKRMEDNFIDLTVTSPPYDNLRDYKGYSFPFEEIAKELYRVTKEGGVIVWVVGDAVINGGETGTSFKQVLYFQKIGFLIHDTMIYKKNGSPYPDKTRYSQNFEYMFILSKGKPKTVNLIKDRKNIYKESWGIQTYRKKDGTLEKGKKIICKDYGVRFNVWEIKTGRGCSTKDKIAYQHPAIFPEPLVKDHIVTWSNEQDLIYDPFMGSGTTAKISHILNRNWIGSEISKEYCQIAKKRLKPYLNQLTIW